MQLNIDQLKQDLCRQLAVIGLIEEAVSKKRKIVSGNDEYYKVFGSFPEKERDLAKINAVIERLNNYLLKLTLKGNNQ